MSFKVDIKNIGKLTDAAIRVGGFTVFAGPNNTGKSFVSKFLYSLFNAMNAHHAETRISQLTAPVERALGVLMSWVQSDDGYSMLDLLESEIRELQALVKGTDTVEELDKIYPGLENRAEKMLETAAGFQNLIESEEEDQDHRFTSSLDIMTSSLVKLKKTLSQTDTKKFIIDGIRYRIRQNLLQNFQVPRLSDLRGEESAPSKVNVGNFGEFQFSNGEIEFNIKSSIKFSWMSQLQRYSRVIYLESPVYWKLKNALEDTREHLHGDRERLTGVPGYFYDLVRALKFEYTGDIAFPNVYERLTGKDVIGGKIAISESGNLSFQEKGRSFSLPVTAMGIANLGILALLIERKVLDEDALIFIDEPEAHLHPAWQVIMAESLFELAKGGASVVIATHSPDILKWLEVHAKKHPGDKSIIALNKFPPDGNEVDEQDFGDKMAAIKQKLTKPFADLYMAGL